MMSNRLLKLSVVVLVAGLGLALVQSRVQAEHDLDSYPDSILERDLSDELDDIYAQLDDPDGEYDLDSLKADILNALGDEGDEGDEEEMEIDLADLNQEMDEAGTTVDSVVDEALARADELASRRGSPSWTIVQATFSGLSLNAQSRDRRTKPRVAIDQTVKTVRVYIRRAR
jgi:hypothetical protein